VRQVFDHRQLLIVERAQHSRPLKLKLNSLRASDSSQLGVYLLHQHLLAADTQGNLIKSVAQIASVNAVLLVQSMQEHWIELDFISELDGVVTLRRRPSPDTHRLKKERGPENRYRGTTLVLGRQCLEEPKSRSTDVYALLFLEHLNASIKAACSSARVFVLNHVGNQQAETDFNSGLELAERGRFCVG
jgi:hypothetical protein